MPTVTRRKRIAAEAENTAAENSGSSTTSLRAYGIGNRLVVCSLNG